jgi:hypothetical protein
MMPRFRILLAVLLAITAGLLALLLFMDPGGGGTSSAAPALRDIAGLGEVIDTVLAHHGIGRSAVRLWKVQSPDHRLLRVERRVAVPPEFVSVRFTHDLSRAVEEFGARAVATERTRENTVTVHIRKDGVVLQSIALVTTPRRQGAQRPHRSPGTR